VIGTFSSTLRLVIAALGSSVSQSPYPVTPDDTAVWTAQQNWARSRFPNAKEVHCNLIRKVRGTPTLNRYEYRVRYEEIASGRKWRKMKAILRNDTLPEGGMIWTLVDGDKPTCQTVIKD